MKSAWEIENRKEFSHLDKDIETDVCVVGGGLCGLWSAYLLAKEGKKVVVLEKDKLGGGETEYTTAFITEVIDTDLSDLTRMFGDERAKLSWQAGAEAIDIIEGLIREEKINCDFMRTSGYSYAASEKEAEQLRLEVAEAERLGFKARMIGSIPGFDNKGAIEVPNQAKYHPMKFYERLVELAEAVGVQFFEKTEAVEVGGKHKIHVLTKSGRSVEAEDVIVSTYEPFNNPKQIHFKKGMYTSYVYGLEIPRDSLTEGIYEDQHNPYHYFRIDDAGDKQTMIIGGEDHRALLNFEENKSFRALKEYIDKTFGNLEYKVTHRWSGKILESSDGLPLIGRYEPHKYLACAFSGNGMTYSAIAGRLLTDLIMGRRNVYAELYSPLRKMEPKAVLRKFRDYGEEFFGGAVKNLFK